jgi:hypothetical protein
VHNVTALPTRADGEQPWVCTVCKKTFAYSQPINWELQLAMLKLFMNWHDAHCTASEVGKEQASG